MSKSMGDSVSLGAIGWLNDMSRVLMKMKGRPFSEKQRNAILGVLLTLDPDSALYVARCARADKQRGSDGESVPDVQEGDALRLIDLIDAEISYNRNRVVGGRWSAELDEARRIASALAANSSACELGAVRELAKAWRARADACVDDFNSGVSTREVTVMRDLADELEADLQQRGDSRGGEG